MGLWRKAMKKRKIVQTAVRFAVCIPLIAGFTSGCASGDGSAVTKYASADAVYTMTFEGGMSGACERSGGTTVMRMTAPEYLAGLSVTCDGSTCSVSVGEMSVLLSAETAAGLTELFDLLARPVEDGGVPAKSADGTETVVTFDTGSVTVGETGVPVEVSHGGRAVTISNFVIQ